MFLNVIVHLIGVVSLNVILVKRKSGLVFVNKGIESYKLWLFFID